MRVLIPLGEASRAEVQSAVERQFGTDNLTWLERQELRRHPLQVSARLAGQTFDDAVLIAGDLHQERLRLTSLILSLTRARHRWRIDLRGNRERWTLRHHVAEHAGPVVRHALACIAAATLSVPLLRLIDSLIKPRQIALKSAPRKILYLRSQLWLGLEGGGSVAHTAGVIGGLEHAGVQVHAVASDHLTGVQATTRVARPEVWFDGSLRELEDLAYNVAFCVGALREIRRFKPDAIYQRHTAFNCAGTVIARVLRMAFVLEFNSSEVWKGRYWGGLRMTRAAELVERINLRAADRVIVVSEVLRQQLIADGIQREKIIVNPNGVDVRVFRPDVDESRIRQQLDLVSSVVVGFSGTFGKWHGIPTLAQVVPMVVQARPQVRWLLIGDGPLRSLIPDSAERVHRVGMLPHAEMPAYLAACDILVSPHGRQADGGEFFGSPTKLYEYMAMGRPIVASAVGQIADVLENGESALLVAPDDAEALRDAILKLVDDACLRLSLGRAARQAAENRHTWLQNAERVLAGLTR